MISAHCSADVVLIGSDIPNASVLDGDFDSIKAGWRNPAQSPYWTTEAVKGGGKVGFAEGCLMISGGSLATAESVVLDHTGLKSLNEGDVLAWRFASNTEYPCDGRVSFALVFGDRERVVADRVKVPNGPDKPQVYEGCYTVTADDAQLGMPRAKFTLESSHGIIVYVHWLDLKLLQDGRVSELAANAGDDGIELAWSEAVGLDRRASRSSQGYCTIYCSTEERKGYRPVAEGVQGNRWVDNSIINGKTYYYAIRQAASVSSVVMARKTDSVPPAAPEGCAAVGEEWMVKLEWKTSDSDVAYCRIYRGGADGGNMTCIAPHVAGNRFEDMLPVKGIENSYAVEAVDFSGNTGPRSAIAKAKVKAVRGASFSDLILPMPVHDRLRSDLWGTATVLPRDPDNGIEDADWSYWGGRPVEGRDGRYHMNIVRWPEGARRGHWEWPWSTVAYAVAERPDGPYRVVRELAYDYNKGYGHNADIVLLNDGRYLLYSLINFKPTLFTSDSLAGPWKLEGEMTVDYDPAIVPESKSYQLLRNLSGVQLEDGSLLFVSKFGRMIKSENGFLGPYKVLSDEVQANETIPEPYRKSNYEDPVMWRDEVQFHMIINAFLDYRAIYLRSPDGIHWKYENGLAYTPACTQYEDGTRTLWYKLERPHVLTDEYGRATHLSLAAIDVPKAEDYGNDHHSSKNLVLPLVVPKRLAVLNTGSLTTDTAEIRVLIRSEEGFDAQNDVDNGSLRFGASEEVDFGRGAKLANTEPHPDGLVLVFDGAGSGIAGDDFAGKLIGKTRDGGLLVGFAKLPNR